MTKTIVVADANPEHCQELCAVLKNRSYSATPVYSLKSLKEYLQHNTYLVAIMNINTLSANNRDIRELTIENPEVYFLGLTDRRFNPELKDAICYHIFACRTIPVDPDELDYWIRCIYKDAIDPRFRTQIKKVNLIKQLQTKFLRLHLLRMPYFY